MFPDVVIILTSENCHICKNVKGDGHIDELNTTRLPGSWWTEQVFRETITGGTDTVKFIVYEFFHKISPDGTTAYITEFIHYCINPKTKQIERHRYFEDSNGGMSYQIGRNPPTTDSRFGKFGDMMKSVVPSDLGRYRAFFPSVLFISGTNYKKSLLGESVLMHAPGFNLLVTSANGKQIYGISPQMTFVESRMNDYAVKVTNGSIDLNDMPDVVQPVYNKTLDEKVGESKLFKKKRKIVSWNAKRTV